MQSNLKLDKNSVAGFLGDYEPLRYLENKTPVFSGKGFKYLAAVIINHHKNRDTVSNNEQLLRGKPPAVVTIRED